MDEKSLEKWKNRYKTSYLNVFHRYSQENSLWMHLNSWKFENQLYGPRYPWSTLPRIGLYGFWRKFRVFEGHPNYILKKKQIMAVFLIAYSGKEQPIFSLHKPLAKPGVSKIFWTGTPLTVIMYRNRTVSNTSLYLYT